MSPSSFARGGVVPSRIRIPAFVDRMGFGPA